MCYMYLKYVDFSKGPHSDILMMGGFNRGSYFIPKKLQTSQFVYPEKSLRF